ncbi:MAG: cysteine desulfurase [Candidatus Bathyarchaeia archaeon]
MRVLLSVQQVRRDIPLLDELVYFDSASVSPPVRPVVDTMSEYYTRFPFNYGVGVFKDSIQVTKKLEDARNRVAKFIDARPTEVVFTKNTTEAINIVARGLDWKKNDEVIITSIEHQSNYIPWLQLARDRGVRVKVAKADTSGIIDVGEIERSIKKETKLVSIAHVSNVLGTIENVSEICKIAREHDVICMVDAAQSVGRLEFSVREIQCDFAAICGRKSIGGPQGTGVLFGRDGSLELLRPLETGSRAADLLSDHDFRTKPSPLKFEAGVLNTAGFLGLGKAVDYLQKLGIGAIRNRIRKLTEYAIDQLRELNDLEIYGPLESNLQAGIISINVKHKGPGYVAKRLDSLGRIAVGSGNHGSLAALETIGVHGTVRLSFHCYNTEKEIDKLAKLLPRT